MLGLSNCIVYVTAFILLVDKIQGERLDFDTPQKNLQYDQIPITARFENADLRNASSGCSTTKMQIFCPHLLHNVANAMGHKTNITNDCSSANLLPHILVSFPQIVCQISILASDLYHASAFCLFQANCSLFLSNCANRNDYIFYKPVQC